MISAYCNKLVQITCRRRPGSLHYWRRSPLHSFRLSWYALGRTRARSIHVSNEQVRSNEQYEAFTVKEKEQEVGVTVTEDEERAFMEYQYGKGYDKQFDSYDTKMSFT